MRITVFLFFVGLSMQLRAQSDIPELKCLSMDDSGQMTVIWESPDDPSGVLNYNIYLSYDENTNFTPVGQVAASETSAVIPADIESVQYVKLSSTTNAGESGFSETLCTIIPEIINNGDGNFTIRWNPSIADYFINNGLEYQIYKSEDGVNYHHVGSTSNTSFDDYVCTGLTFYCVEIEGDGCVSMSKSVSEIYTDITPPTGPDLIIISVDENGHTFLEWNPSPEPDIDRYVIEHYEFEDNRWKWIKYDSVPAGTHTYVDRKFDACNEAQTFVVYAVDHCGNKYAPNQLNPPTTILLDEPVFDRCQEQITITWSEYINPQHPVEHYEVWLAIDGQTSNLIATHDSNVLTHTYTDVEVGKDYRFQIKAMVNNVSSESCKKEVFTTPGEVPNYLDIKAADVRPDNFIDLHLSFDFNDDMEKVLVKRSDNADDQLQVIGESTDLNNGIMTFRDEDVAPNQGQYTYQIAIVDDCQDIVKTGNIVKTCFLSGTSQNQSENQLRWTAYESENQSVQEYQIYCDPGTGSFAQIASVDASSETYIHNLSGLDSGSGKYHYYVQVVLDNMTPYGTGYYPKSNIIEVKQTLQVKIPNAFAPGGHNENKIFKPLTSGVVEGSYKMIIYNKWGQQLFVSNNPENGWDGTFKGEQCQSSVYVYLIQINDAELGLQEYKGTVLLIR